MAEKQTAKTQNRFKLPLCDIYGDGQDVKVVVEMPGVTKEGLDIKVDGDLLIISGKRTPVTHKGTYLVREIREGDYYHEFTIDETVERNKIDASLEKGLLTLTLGIKESEKPRKIEVVAK